MALLAAVLVTYVAASISPADIIARSRGIDLRRVGTRSGGGGNVWADVGPLEGALVGLADIAKGCLAFVLPGALGLPPHVQLACAITAVAGQMWPAFHRFDGGRGNSTAWGFELAAQPASFAVAIALPAAAGLLRVATRAGHTRLVPLASLLSFALWPWLVAEGGDGSLAVGGAAALWLILARRLTAHLGADLALGASPVRVLLNRALFDRTEVQERELARA